ncbi:SigE family RNA polymerase sigma factor [Nocardioides daejeonensis]|uniref:SigE family RNA polymerase sigma factor n=1 Tax=Nocardioides daejeonensis TaxID=1046556 RepID=UPI00194FFCCB|nr:SigE family RNA polymerase sigma factor [Nocardioides daejeonensis]
MKRKRSVEEFTTFVQETGAQLHRAALLLTGDHHLAEDLTQATYAKTFAAWSRVSAADSPLAYARTTLLNTYLSHRRLRRNSEQPVDDSLFSHQEVHATDPTTRLDLFDALATLAPLDRAIVVLRYWEDRSVADAAHDLGITQETVRTRSRRALARLRPLLEAHHPGFERTTP